jgi:hypothetical protein
MAKSSIFFFYRHCVAKRRVIIRFLLAAVAMAPGVIVNDDESNKQRIGEICENLSLNGWVWAGIGPIRPGFCCGRVEGHRSGLQGGQNWPQPSGRHAYTHCAHWHNGRYSRVVGPTTPAEIPYSDMSSCRHVEETGEEDF